METTEAKETARNWKRRGREEVDRLVAEYQASGQSVRTFAEERGVKECTMRGWLYRRRRSPEAAVALQEVKLRAGTGDGASTGLVVVRTAGGAEVELPLCAGWRWLERMVLELVRR